MPQGRGLRLPLISGRRSYYAEGFALWATSFALGGKGGKTPPGVSRGRLSAPAVPPPDPRLRGLSLRPSAEVPARKIRFRVSILSGPLVPGAVQNFSFCHFIAAPGSGQPWQRVQDRVCAGQSRSYKPEPPAGFPPQRSGPEQSGAPVWSSAAARLNFGPTAAAARLRSQLPGNLRLAAAGGSQRKAQRSGFALERRRAESLRPTDVMVYGGRAGQETRPYNVSGGSQQDGKTGGASPSPTGRWGSTLRRRTQKAQHPAGP